MNTILETLGIDSKELFFGNTLVVATKGKPFGVVHIENGKSVLRVGDDVPKYGHRIDLDVA